MGEIIEANGGKVRIRRVDQFLYPYNQVYFFHNANTTVENFQKAKAYAYSTVFERHGLDIKGRLYDWAEFLRFINPKIKDNPNADICSRNSWDIQKKMGNPIIDEDKFGRISPTRIGDYLIDEVLNYQIPTPLGKIINIDNGWRCSIVWNCTKFEFLSDVLTK